jgi:hypothetical protein
MAARQILRTTGWALLVVGAALGFGALVVRDQIERHRRDLFSGHPLRRLAALSHLAAAEPTVETIQLLRDFISWEPQPLLRRRAAQVLRRLQRTIRTEPFPGRPPAGVAGKVAG